MTVNWYDRPEVYDALYAWNPRAERDFVAAAAARYGNGPATSFLEPFCGTGRLLAALPGRVIGFDRNPRMLRVAATRAPVFLADAAGFAVAPGSFDAAFCLIDSFRYLLTEDAAASHLRCIAHALKPGGVYVLGFDLAGDTSKDRWTVGDTSIEVGMLGDDDPNTRIETLRVRLDVAGEKTESFQPMRTYTAAQVRSLLNDEGSFEPAAAFDRRYDLDAPHPFEDSRGSVVLVLRKTCPAVG